MSTASYLPSRRRVVRDYLALPAGGYLPDSAPARLDWLGPAPELMRGGGLVERAAEPAKFSEVESGRPILEGRMIPYNEWTEVTSKVEGHFFERFVRGALVKTLGTRARQIRVLFEHGFDSVIGRQVIAAVEDLRDEPDGAYYRASLLDGLPPLLVSGLRRGLYGSSIRFGAIKWDKVRSPGRSAHNPDGIPEHTIREARLQEFSVVTFPQYAGATAIVRGHKII